MKCYTFDLFSLLNFVTHAFVVVFYMYIFAIYPQGVNKDSYLILEKLPPE